MECKTKRKEGNVLFNDALNTYLQLHDVGHRAKDYLDSEKGNPLVNSQRRIIDLDVYRSEM